MLVCMDLTPGWGALAYAVQQRRARLGMTQEDISARGGPSTVTVRNIESAASGNFRARTLFQLDEALAWGKGTSQEIVEGSTSYMGPFEEFINYVIKDTSSAERRGDDYPVGWQVESRHQGSSAGLLMVGHDGTHFRYELKRSRRFADASDDELISELAARLKERTDAQEPESQQGTGGSAGGGTGGGGTPMTGAESETPVRDPIPDHLSGESTRSAQ